MGYSFRSYPSRYHLGWRWCNFLHMARFPGVFLGSMACVQARGLCVEQFRKSGGLHAVARDAAAYLHSLLSSARAWNRLEGLSPGASFATVSTTSRHGNVGRLQDGSDWASMFPLGPVGFLWAPGFVSELLGYLRHIHSGTTGGLTNAFSCAYKIAD